MTLSQRVHDIAERLSTHAKAEIYQVLEGIAPNGELSSLLRLEPLVNDIVLQLNDSFKQAVTKRLLPEACKLLGSRPAALAAAASPSWAGGQAPQPPSPNALGSNVKQHSHLENDILALGYAPGTGQPLRPDQGPPQDAASAAASSLLLGASATAPGPQHQHQSPSPPPSGSDGGTGSTKAALHPPESRFAFANAVAAGDSRRGPLSGPLARDSFGGASAAASAGGAAAADLGPASDPLLFLGLGECDAGLGFGAGGADASSNGLALGADSFILGSSLAGSIGGSNGSGGGFAAASPSPHAASRQLAALSLGTPSGGGAAAIRTTSAASSPSPNPSTPSPYSALPLTIRPGSSLDPGLATPPVSLPGTEPVRGGPHALALHHIQTASPQQQQLQQRSPQLTRLSGPGDLSPLTPLSGGGGGAPAPLFGGAPGPSPGGGGGGSAQQQMLRQQQMLQQQQMSPQQQQQHYGAGGAAVGEGGMLPGGGGAGLFSNGNGNGNGNGNMASYQLQQQQQQLLLQRQQQLQQAQFLQQQQQQQGLAEYQQRQQYGMVQQQQQQQLPPMQHPNAPYDSTGAFAPVSGVRTALAAAPDGPRASYDGRTPTYAVQNALEMPYDVQLFYGAGAGTSPAELQQAMTAFGGDRFASLGAGIRAGFASGGGAGGSSGGTASPDYGMYGLAPLGAAGGALQPGVMVGGGGGRTGGSPTMMLAQAAAAPAANRPSRSGTASAASAVDSRSSSFSTGPMGHQPAARRGSGGGNGGGATLVQSPFTPQQHSPPASDASGPSSSSASVSVTGAAVAAAGVGGGIAKAAGGGTDGGVASMSMAAKLQQVQLQVDTSALASPKPAPSPGGSSRAGKTSSGSGGGVKAPADMPGRFRCLPPAVQARIHALTRDNHVVLLKDFDEKVLSKMTLLVDKFGAAECLAMLDRIEEVLKGKAGRLANGPGYLDVSVSTRLDELKQRASGQVTAPEDYARSTLHSRIYAELRDLISRHGFLQWHHFDQGIINMLKKMPNATALERLNELAYHSFKNVDNPKSCIVSIFTTKPKYVNA